MEEEEGCKRKPIEGKSSIETEPRTLDSHQIQFAREAALHVVKSKSMEEALSVFTEGLKPVTSGARRQRGGVVVVQRWEDSDRFNVDDDGDDHLIRLPSIFTEQRDVVSAPF